MIEERILCADVCVLNYESLKSSIEKDISSKRKVNIVAINPEKILKMKDDTKLNNELNKFTYKIADGMGVVLVSKLKHGKITKRVTGIDCMNMLCALANEKKYKIFLYGAKPGVAVAAKEQLEKKYRKINIVGVLDGYEKNSSKIIKIINKSKADIIFVALGSPKQEYWIVENMKYLNVKVFQGVGGSYDVISGNIKRAPVWMQKFGLEWFFRLLKEPKRIFRQFRLLKFIILCLKKEGK